MKSEVARRSLRGEDAGPLTISDWLTLVRLAGVPILWILAVVMRDPYWLGIGVAVAAFTDVLDGQIARRTHHTTARGSRLDSIADHLLTVSLVLWIVWFRPAFIAEQLPLLVAWGIVGVAALVVGWVRFRRIGDLHLYSAKVSGVVAYLFGIWLLTFGTYNQTVFYIVMALLFIGSGENLLVVATRKSVDEHVGSILLRRRGQRQKLWPEEREGREGREGQEEGRLH